MKYAFGVFILLPILMIFPLGLTADPGRGWIAWLIHAPTMFAFLITIIGVIFVTGQFKTCIKIINALFSKKYKISPDDTQKGISLLELLKKTTIYAATFFTMGSLMFMLGDINDLQSLGPMLSLILLIPMYAAIINLIYILPAIHILKTRQNETQKPITINEREVINKLLELCYKQGIPPEQILNAEQINFKE
jgi:flagellar motor component MotA